MPQNIYPALRYRDAHAAIEWLTEALGFEVVSLMEADGRVAHAELGFGDGMIMLGSTGGGDEQFDRGVGCSSIYLVAEDVDAAFERARAAGVSLARELQDMDYGSREFTATDPEGNFWSVGTYVPERHPSS